MKKMLSIAVCLFLLVTLAGCGEEPVKAIDWTICDGKYVVTIPQTWDRKSITGRDAYCDVPNEEDRVCVKFYDEILLEKTYTDTTIKKMLKPTVLSADTAYISTIVDPHKTTYGTHPATSATYNVKYPPENKLDDIEIIQQDVIETPCGLLTTSLRVSVSKYKTGEDGKLKKRDEGDDSEGICQTLFNKYAKVYEKILESITEADA